MTTNNAGITTLNRLNQVDSGYDSSDSETVVVWHDSEPEDDSEIDAERLLHHLDLQYKALVYVQGIQYTDNESLLCLEKFLEDMHAIHQSGNRKTC